MAASGAAFTAIALGQAANVFTCRSGTVPAWRIETGVNNLLVGAVAAEIMLLATLLCVMPVAHLLSHSVPSAAGFLVATTAVPAVLLADGWHKWIQRRKSDDL